MPDLVSIGGKKHNVWALYNDKTVERYVRRVCDKYAKDFGEIFGDGFLMIRESIESMDFESKHDFSKCVLRLGQRGKKGHLKARTTSLENEFTDSGLKLYDIIPSRIINPERALILKEMNVQYFNLAGDDPQLKDLAVMLCEGLNPIEMRRETGMSLMEILNGHRELTSRAMLSGYLEDVSHA